MWEDPIVKEVRSVPREHAARRGDDLYRIYADFREREKRGLSKWWI